jgi:hypothetical protein
LGRSLENKANSFQQSKRKFKSKANKGKKPHKPIFQNQKKGEVKNVETSPSRHTHSFDIIHHTFSALWIEEGR